MNKKKVNSRNKNKCRVVCDRNPLYMELEIHGGWIKKRGWQLNKYLPSRYNPVNSSSAIESDFNVKKPKTKIENAKVVRWRIFTWSRLKSEFEATTHH